MSNYNKNKRAQIAETITWVVATLIIIFLLITAIYFSSVLGKGKNVKTGDLKISGEESDWINIKNSLAYNLNSNNEEIIKSWIVGGTNGN